MIHYEQCQNHKLAVRLLAGGIARYDFDRATARQRGTGGSEWHCGKECKSESQNHKLAVRLLAGGI
ncbi:MAG: hypothetical protein NC089_04155 [Bacteroides sp.]|nr:hypothetical protein [Bacteroides sp.]MCM1548588.1 hypothetical protein [Clostridium sp.]